MSDGEVGVAETGYSGNVSECVLYMHVETQSERLMRLSNRIADAVAHVGMISGVSLDYLAEAADVLAKLSRIVDRVEHLGDWERGDG